MRSEVSPLFVRLPAAQAQQLDVAVAASGKTKRQLVSEAVREHLTDDGLVVGHASIQETGDEVMTVGEAAVLLKLDESTVLAAAESLDLPGRQIAGHWRFSRRAVLDWLSGDRREEPSSETSGSV
ncbi:MAG: helix-turn-helix domain-containing protein [Solirubrobacteraceae bacterium]|jgi:excisionase family DNA binding protein